MGLLSLFLVSLSCVQALTNHAEENPIRKIVTLMQDMQKEIEAEGEKEQKSYEKFECYCSGSNGDMNGAAEKAQQMQTELSSKLAADKAQKAQLDQELKDHASTR